MARQTKEQIAARMRAHRAAHRAELAAKKKAYRAAHRAEIAAYDKAYAAAHREEINAKGRRYNAAHRAEIAARRDPAKVRAWKAIRQARVTQNGGGYTAAEWRTMRAWFGNVCLCCGARGKLSPDHVVPVISGGAGDIANIQPLCPPCNLGKGANTADYRDPAKLATLLAFLASMRGVQ